MLGRLAAAGRLVVRTCPGLAAAYLGSAVVAGLVPAVAVFLLSDIAEAVATGRRAEIVGLGLGIVVSGLIGAVLPAAQQFLTNEMSRRTGRAAQDELYRATERLTGLAAFEDPRFRDRLRLAQYGGRAAPAQAVDAALGLAQGAITIVGLALVLLRVSVVITVVALLAAVPALLVELRVSRDRADVMVQTSPHERREFFYSDLLTSLEAAKEVRLLGLGTLFRVRMIRELGAADASRGRIDRRELRVGVGLGLLGAGVAGTGLVLVLAAVPTGAAGVGAVVAYLGGIGGLQAAVSAQVTRLSMVHTSLTLFGHFLDVRDVEPDLTDGAGGALPALRRGITVRDVWFRYGPDGPWILRGVSLHIAAGSSLALVGVNGAGKSTLVKLLCRFYEPTRGQILWDGVDIRDVAVVELRDRIGAVFQDYMTYDLTAAENIGLGDIAAMDDRASIEAAADRAGIASTLAALPAGYDTMLSRAFGADDGDADGVLLSGGQWQRLALARAAMREGRELLILDEPSSGLDARAEHELHARLRRHRGDSAAVLISHRLGSIRDADRIAVLVDGRVAEEGTHDELVRLPDGAYARLFRLQADGYRDDHVLDRVG